MALNNPDSLLVCVWAHGDTGTGLPRCAGLLWARGAAYWYDTKPCQWHVVASAGDARIDLFCFPRAEPLWHHRVSAELWGDALYQGNCIPVFPAAPQGSPRVWDRGHWAQPRMVDWPWVKHWLGNRKNELLCKNWEGSQRLRDLHPLPFHTCSSSISLSPGSSRSTWGSSRYPSIAGMQLGSRVGAWGVPALLSSPQPAVPTAPAPSGWDAFAIILASQLA